MRQGGWRRLDDLQQSVEAQRHDIGDVAGHCPDPAGSLKRDVIPLERPTDRLFNRVLVLHQLVENSRITLGVVEIDVNLADGLPATKERQADVDALSQVVDVRPVAG